MLRVSNFPGIIFSWRAQQSRPPRGEENNSDLLNRFRFLSPGIELAEEFEIVFKIK